jgi:hypothetical protein
VVIGKAPFTWTHRLVGASTYHTGVHRPPYGELACRPPAFRRQPFVDADRAEVVGRKTRHRRFVIAMEPQANGALSDAEALGQHTNAIAVRAAEHDKGC